MLFDLIDDLDSPMARKAAAVLALVLYPLIGTLALLLGTAGTVIGTTFSYFQDLYVFFRHDAPEDLRLLLKTAKTGDIYHA